jgi:hypothetical protein
MAIQKKSLIGNLKAAKKAIVATKFETAKELPSGVKLLSAKPLEAGKFRGITTKVMKFTLLSAKRKS